jgi:hypothetical protein
MLKLKIFVIKNFNSSFFVANKKKNVRRRRRKRREILMQLYGLIEIFMHEKRKQMNIDEQIIKK